MLSSVFLSGRLGDIDEENPLIRYVEIDRLVPDCTGKFPVDKMPILATHSNARFLSAKKGQMIILKGRLQVEEGTGLVIVDELEEIVNGYKNN